MRASQLALLLAAGLTLAACASYPGKPSPAGAQTLSAAEARGRDFAYRRCSGCHNVGPDDTPSDGPRFSKLAMLYNPLSLQQRFAQVSAHGVDRMPPVSFTRSEAEDLLAYVQTLAAR